ncbi:MAG: signal peptidase II [Chthoniobacterales bacterium]
MKPLHLLLAVTLPLYVFDQLTKWATLVFIPLHHEIPIVPGLFNLVHVTNTGSAFGLMKGWFSFHVVFGAIMAGVIGWMLFRHDTDRLTRFACAMILSGIFGNITDRLIHGHVVDFLDFYIGQNHWPAFNVADSAIVVSVAIFLWTSFRRPTAEASASAEKP